MKKKTSTKSKVSVDRLGPFSIRRCVYYHLTDANGSIYHANHLRLIEEAIVDFLESRGIRVGDLFKKELRFATVQVSLQYISPVGYGDLIQIYPAVKKVGTSSIQFEIRVKRQSALVASASVVWVCIGHDFASRPLPVSFKARLS